MTSEESQRLQGEVRRNTLLLAVSLAFGWSVVQLAVALAGVTFRQMTGQAALAGVAPGSFLASWAVGGLLIGRLMDSRGRRFGLLLGFGIGVAGAAVLFASVTADISALFLAGLALLGAGLGGVNLARIGAADMYSPERRARGISFVLVGAALGAILSPLAFSPLLQGVRGDDSAALATPWLVGLALLVVGAVATGEIRTDPQQIARSLRGPQAGGPMPAARPLGQLLAVPGISLALWSAVATQAVMASMMTLVGVILVQHGYDLGTTSLVLSVHFLGMFGLVLVAGQVVDRIGRERSLLLGLLVLGIGLIGFLAGVELITILPAMFAIGVGWNISFVAATAMMADASSPSERARLLGFSDFAAVGASAVTSVVSGAVLGLVGLAAVVALGSILVLSPLGLLVARRPAAAQS